ncbi:mucin-2-like [Plectropomus leopardus]|uniref:mucin-2-like n=1 Tax=Plectropomus leopardus TaxID=160734 RepID=UPI001C4A9756|nr:mucin-2-like [Plectropomus leopardus]
MAFLRTSLCAVIMVTVVLSKPVCVSDCEDSSKSSESAESNSSEEAVSHVEPSPDPLQPAFTGTDETVSPVTAALLPSADAGPPPTTPDTSALPNPEHPQTSTDTEARQLVPDDPSQTAQGVDISQNMPVSDPAHVSVHSDTVHAVPDAEVSLHPGLTDTGTTITVSGTNQPQVTTTYQRFPQSATPPSPPHIIKPTPTPFSRAPPLPIALGTALPGVPVCFTFQFPTQEPDPPRGDSI